MTDNRQWAAVVLAEVEQYDDIRLRQSILTAALDAAEERGRKSVGLGDFLPDPCGEETRVAYPHDYGWLRCTRRAGHDGDHEEGSTGYTWPRDGEG